jgi:hypothetical protein
MFGAFQQLLKEMGGSYPFPRDRIAVRRQQHVCQQNTYDYQTCVATTKQCAEGLFRTMGSAALGPLRENLETYQSTHLGGNGSVGAITLNGACSLLDSKYEQVREQGRLRVANNFRRAMGQETPQVDKTFAFIPHTSNRFVEKTQP